MPLSTKARPLWEDRFARPTLEALLAELPKPAAALVGSFREALLAREGITEELAWQGVPWRWALAFAAGAGPGLAADRVVAYVVPNPVRPLACVPVPSGLVTGSVAKKLSKPTRDAIRFAPSIGGVQWPQWELTSKSVVDELATLVRLALEAPVAV
jgi:hypothetical protein